MTVSFLRKNLVLGKIDDITINYLPREWGGPGFLGCVLKITPL